MSVNTKEKDGQSTGTLPNKPRRGFLQHAAVYGLGAISLQLVSIILMPIYTEQLSTAEYGLLQTIYRVAEVLNVCLMVNGICLATFNVWGSNQDDAHRRHLPASVIIVTLLVIVAGALLTWMNSQYIAVLLGFPDHRLLAVGIIAMMLNALTVIPLTLMQARLESTWYVISTLLITVSQLTLVTLSLLVFHQGVWGVVIALAITFAFFGSILTIRELLMSSFLPMKEQMRDIMRFSLPFVPNGLFFFILHSGDQFFLLRYHGLAAVGVYAVAYKITKGVATFSTQPFFQVWQAWMYDAYRQPDSARVFGRVYTRIVSALILAGAGLILFQQEILLVLSTAKFARAGSVIGLLVFAHIFLIFGSLLDGAFYVTRRTDLKPWIAAASAFVMTVAYASLIPRWEIYGAASATLIGFMFFCGLNMFVAQKVFPVKLEYRRLAIILSLATSASLLGQSLGVGALPFLAKTILLGLIPAVLWWFSIVSPDEKTYIRHVVRRSVFWLWGGTMGAG